MSERPWRNPAEEDLVGWDRPLPETVRLSPDYGVEAPLIPLWGNGFGNISWQFTKLPPAMLDRLVAWQEIFEKNFQWERGWVSKRARAEWTERAETLATDLQEELDGRATVVLDLWPLDDFGSGRNH
jgi:hypothetical protein